jgi:hypothetical protein
MAWATLDTLKAAISDELAKDVMVEPNSPWPGRAAAALENAKQTLRGIVIGRGYTASQADAWDAGASFHLDLAKFFAFGGGGAANTPNDYQTEMWRSWDRREEAKEAPITNNGRLVTPAVDEPETKLGTVMVGRLSCKDDLFRFPRGY